MIADDILKALTRAADDLPKVRALMNAPQRRREEINARLAAISMTASSAIEPPPARAAALRSGVAAMQALDEEEKALLRERGMLDSIEASIYARVAELEAEAIRAAIPKARKTLPGQMDAVRRAAAEFDQALAALRGTVETLGQYPRAGLDLPLSPDELAALLELREEMWSARREVAALQPPPKVAYGRAFSLFYTALEGSAYRARRAATDSRGDVRAVDDDVPARTVEPFTRAVRRFIGR
jgi:hypothetical protein